MFCNLETVTFPAFYKLFLIDATAGNRWIVTVTGDLGMTGLKSKRRFLMYRHLMADYILGYALSTDLPFTTTEIAEELSVPTRPVIRMIRELHKMKGHWFVITEHASDTELTIVRNVEFDEELIVWLVKGESKKQFRKTEVLRYYNRPAGKVLAKLLYILSLSSAIRSITRFLTPTFRVLTGKKK